MIDYDKITIEQFRNRAIAIDTEYQTDLTGAITRVYCVCASDSRGRVCKHWVDENESCEGILETISGVFGIPNPIFVAHAYDMAERPALLFLNADPHRRDWFCTFHGARLSHNAFKMPDPPLGAFSLSYAALVKRVLGVEIDTHHKSEMRMLCITGRVEGHEQEILDYCTDDTRYLIPLAEREVLAYQRILAATLPIHAPFMTKNALGLILMQCSYFNVFGRIAETGFPVDPKRLKTIAQKSEIAKSRLYANFAKSYPGTFTYTPPKRQRAIAVLREWLGDDFDLSQRPADVEAQLKRELEGAEKGEKREALKAFKVWMGEDSGADDSGWHGKLDVIQTYLARDVQRLGYEKTYPKTDTGQYCTGADCLKDFFKGTGGFGEALYKLNKKLSSLKGASGDWAQTLVGSALRYRTLRPFASATGRCQPKPGDGFVLGWAHYLYGVLDPPEGKWLVELDYSSEETGIQAILCRDRGYCEAYTQKDIYCWVGAQIGLIPRGDYQTMSKSELKEKYGHIRSRLKTFFLAWGYGCGVEKLAARAGLSVERAAMIKAKLENEIFRQSSLWKKEFCAAAKSKYCAVAFPDGWLCRTKLFTGEKPKTANSLKNFPFQGYGAFILRRLAVRLVEMPSITPVATMHDALMFMVDAGDYESIERVKELMETTANNCLGVKDFIKVGSPDIVKHGEIWAPDPEDVDEFKALLETPDDEDDIAANAFFEAHPELVEGLDVEGAEGGSEPDPEIALDWSDLDLSGADLSDLEPVGYKPPEDFDSQAFIF